MDKIIVLSQGKTIEEGAFTELLDKGGVFFGLAKAQGITS
jgi:ABC-type multidrug transport system fused ATPase/permease subunit